MRRRHLRAVLRIESQTQARGWSLGLFLGELARPDGRCYLVAKVGSQVVGFGGMLFVGTDGHVTTLSVDPAWRRQGIATRLLAALCREAVDRGRHGAHPRGPGPQPRAPGPVPGLRLRAGRGAPQLLLRDR